MLRRLDDWPARLHAYIRARHDMPFAWGSQDCCTFAISGGVEALTGVLLWPDVARPTTEFGAARFLVERGYRDPSDLASELFGSPLSTPRLAQRRRCHAGRKQCDARDLRRWRCRGTGADRPCLRSPDSSSEGMAGLTCRR